VSPRLRFVIGSWLLLAAAACSSDPAPSDAAAGGGGAASGGASASSGGKAGSKPQSCPAGINPPSPVDPIEVGVVSGELVDERGEPTTAGLVQVCGTDICRNADVADSGKFADYVAGLINAPACKFGDGFEWAKLAVPLGEGNNELGTLVTVRLPDYGEGVPLVAGKTATSGGVSLVLAEDARVQHNIIDYESEAQRVLRAVRLPGAALAQADPDFVVGFALSPLETRICPNPALSLENDPELAAGTELELYLLGLDAEEEFVPYARWQKVAEGRVSDDGESLEFPDGVPLLTAIAVKVKP
jgi:hypothetical protein